MRGSMDRRSLTLAGVSMLGLLVAAQPSFAQQSNPLLGNWKINLEKSKFATGAAPKSATLRYEQDGQNIKNTTTLVDAQGKEVTGTLLHIYDGMPHPSTGNPEFDSSSYTRVDANTLIIGRFKAGKLIAIGTLVISPDGKTSTVTSTGTGVGLAANTGVTVFDKQ